VPVGAGAGKAPGTPRASCGAQEAEASERLIGFAK
jgi:hypothetical protein